MTLLTSFQAYSKAIKRIAGAKSDSRVVLTSFGFSGAEDVYSLLEFLDNRPGQVDIIINIPFKYNHKCMTDLVEAVNLYPTISWYVSTKSHLKCTLVIPKKVRGKCAGLLGGFNLTASGYIDAAVPLTAKQTRALLTKVNKIERKKFKCKSNIPNAWKA